MSKLSDRSGFQPHLFKRLVLMLLVWLAISHTALAYDSLQTALRLHQSSQYQKALPIFIELASKFRARGDLPNYAICQTKIADIIRNYGGAHIAIELLERNEKTIAAGLEVPSLVMAQNYLAKADAYLGALNLADFKSSIMKSIHIKKGAKLTDKYFAEDYFQLARYYKEIPDRNDSCYYWVNRALKCAMADKTFSLYTLPRIYNMLGHYYHPASNAYFGNRLDSLVNHYRISRLYYDSALLAIAQQPIADELLLAKIYHNLGNYFSNQGGDNIHKALKYYRKAVRIYEALGSPSELSAEDWVIGRAFERLHIHDSSLASFQNGIKRLVPTFKPNSLNDLPAIQPTLNDMWYTSHVVTKGNVFYQRYLANHDLQDLTAAYNHYSHLLKFNRYLVAKSLHEEEQIHWSHLYGSNAYQLLVKTGLELARKTNNREYIQNIYGLIASAKYSFLNKGIIRPETTASINRSLLREESSIVTKNIMKNIPQLSESQLVLILPSYSTEAPSLSQIDLTRQFTDSVTLKDLQLELNREQAALIDFYFVDDYLYIIEIGKESFEIQRSMFPKMRNTAIENLKKDLLKLSPVGYARLSNHIYRSTLDSALMFLPKGTNRLIISPDGVLQEIAWDALVTDTVENQSYKSLHYLIDKYSIRTVMTPLHIFNSFKKFQNSYYGIAPGFRDSKRFSDIPFSSALVSSKAKDFKGTFTHTISTNPIDANILHIASHVTTDPMHPYNSTIHLGEMDSLTVFDLSKSKINSNLIILNGCRTGNGQYVPSEGTISIARAFYLLGAKSVITTLWSVDDKATADVLKVWYDNIEDGEDLDIALRQAKLDFISNAASDESANPFYWAGLQLTGSSKPILHTNMAANVFWSLLALFVVPLSIILIQRRKRKVLNN